VLDELFVHVVHSCAYFLLTSHHMGSRAVMRPDSFVDFGSVYKLFVCLLNFLHYFLPSLFTS